jgi:serine/threonine protein kinase
MDLVCGSTYDIFKKTGKQPFPGELINILLKQMLESLTALHNNDIIHCDIKPDNILINALLPEHIELQKNLVKIHTEKKTYQAVVDYIIDNFNDIIDSDNILKSESILSLSSIEEQVLDYKNFKIVDFVLSDLGTCVDKKNTLYTYTSYYKAPEIILKLKNLISSPIDIWGLGCTIYELLTGKMLFDVNESINIADRLHLYQISYIIGEIPKEMIVNSPLYDVFYKVNGTLKGVLKARFNTLDTLYLNEYIKKMLIIDPNQRISAKKLLTCLINTN